MTDIEQPRIRSIKEFVDSGLRHVPAKYVRPSEERPCLSKAPNPTLQVPIIDLANFHAEGTPQIIKEIGLACDKWGIFQVINHGVSPTLQNQLWKAVCHFFALPTEDKMRLNSEDPSSPLRFFTGFVTHERVREWKDTLGFKPSPTMDRKLLPDFLRDPMLDFHKQVKVLAHILCEAIFASLALEGEVFNTHFSRETIGFNYYPACPEPELTFGLSSHSDFGSLTILMQDEVAGLQVRKGDEWVAVKPISNTFVVILGDQIEILTNGCYKSVEHRVVTNTKKPRMSIACFYGPNEDEKVRPLDKFVSGGSPTLYKETIFSDYLKNGFSKGLNGKSNLEFIRHKLAPPN